VFDLDPLKEIIRELAADLKPFARDARVKDLVLSDQIVNIGQSGKKEARPDHKIRLVCVKCSSHTSRGKYRGGSTGGDSDGILRIATNLLDVPAEVIALIYSWRWTIEIFFRSHPSTTWARYRSLTPRA
jgi:hypothetical protein